LVACPFYTTVLSVRLAAVDSPLNLKSRFQRKHDMQTHSVRFHSLLAPALVLGLVATASPAFGQAAPFTLHDGPAVPLVDPSTSPLMMYLAANEPAARNEPQADDWRFRLSFPIWMPGISGDMTVRGRELSDGKGNGGGDFWETLDFAAMVHFEAEKGPWGGYVDLLYVSFKDERDIVGGQRSADVNLDAFIGELGGYYTFVMPKPGVKGWGMFRADVLAGVRVSSLDISLETDQRDLGRNLTLVDPIVGARLELGLTDWLSFKLRGDIGGFGIDPGTTSNFVWNVDTGLEFHLAKWCDVGIGYRWLDYDFESGSTECDLLLSGPVVTIQFRF
jgi:opacity protein-like surface antigen